ncbi:GDP-L-fucose synthase [Methylobacterium sp. Leaf117]|uniref:GDP-L-fucose synthase n=1 Tax=Methylobacterium sp. Leaf117 TaxID=1736260 RepID=UPI0006F614BA|nr:GDP-L-fucose synthase [Methylobacterium sp. Leaf117]KQP96045.1 GDP-fucose synthetase [Methylobacterium sp. Leaf117]
MTSSTERSGSYDLTGKRVLVAGHRGMVGAALVRRLASENCTILTLGRDNVDLRRQAEVEAWMAAERPQALILAAAKVGGIVANDTYPADFLYDNLMIEANLIQSAHAVGVEKLLFLGSSCIYPKMAAQPMTEDALLTGPLEPTNEWYAIAKIAGLKLCQAYRRQHGADFISAMPTNLYGPGDNYDPQGSHVLPALLRKVHEARRDARDRITLWGTGTPFREFLHVDDLADACIFLMRSYSGDGPVNVGSGQEVTIRALAETIADVLDWQGQLDFDTTKPDGTPRKRLDTSRLEALGWRPRIGLRDGIAEAYAWFRHHHPEA